MLHLRQRCDPKLQAACLPFPLFAHEAGIAGPVLLQMASYSMRPVSCWAKQVTPGDRHIPSCIFDPEGPAPWIMGVKRETPRASGPSSAREAAIAAARASSGGESALLTAGCFWVARRRLSARAASSSLASSACCSSLSCAEPAVSGLPEIGAERAE